MPTTDLLLDRGMMGDGVIDLAGLREAVEAEGYAGFHEVEIFLLATGGSARPTKSCKSASSAIWNAAEHT